MCLVGGEPLQADGGKTRPASAAKREPKKLTKTGCSRSGSDVVPLAAADG